MAKVSTPVEGFTGTVAGIEFKDGKGETDDVAALGYFARHGYDIERPKSESSKPAAKKSSAKK